MTVSRAHEPFCTAASILDRRATCRLVTSVVASALALPGVTADAPMDAALSRIVAEDFDFPKRYTKSAKAPYGAFADDNSLGQCYVFFEDDKDDVLSGGGFSLLLQWDTSQPGAYAGYWQELSSLNLSDHNFLTFFIKGSKGGEILKVGLRGKRDSYESKIFVHEALRTGVTTNWQKIVIPLGWFQAVESWSDVSVFSLNFEHAFGSGKGQILVDEIAFEK